MSQIIEHTLRLISRRHIRMMVFGMGLGGLVGCTCLSARPEEVVGNIAVVDSLTLVLSHLRAMGVASQYRSHV